ncbi:MAG: hypothetical protein ACREOD_00020 [Candidatus Dormibacteria bacterium]
MYIGPLTGSGGKDSIGSTICVYFPGGSETFSDVVVAMGKDEEDLRLYQVTHRDEKSTAMRLRAAFPKGGWLRFSVESGSDPTANALGFRAASD